MLYYVACAYDVETIHGRKEELLLVCIRARSKRHALDKALACSPMRTAPRAEATILTDPDAIRAWKEGALNA